MSDEKRDTPTSSLTQAGDIVDTFWDIKPIEFPRLDGDEETSTLPPQDGSDTTTPFGELPVFSGPDQTDESTTESASDNAGADDFAADMVAQPVIPERKINPWLIVTIVATVVIIIGLVIGGLVYWNSLKKDDAHSTAMSQCLSSSDNYTKASEKLSKALENSKSVQAITDGQVADATTVSTLKSAVTEANSIGKAASCNYIAPTASLSKSAKSNRALTAKLESSAKAVTTAAKAVTKSQEQKKIDTAKQKLQSAVSDAQQTLADSDGAVSDESTRDSLQKALDDANALLKQSNPKAADLEKSLTNLQDATKAVKSSMDDYTAAQQRKSSSSQNSGGNNGYSSNSGTSNGGVTTDGEQVDQGTSTTPTTPDTPTTPTTPDTPTTPTTPTKPDQPTNPTNPTDPDQPTTPTNPDQSGGTSDGGSTSAQ